MKKKLNILFLADNKHPANVVSDHVNALTRHSKHHWTVVNPIHNRICLGLNFNDFDVIVIHYSLCILYDWYLPAGIRTRIANFKGLKMQFIQDEYRWVNQISDCMVELGVNV